MNRYIKEGGDKKMKYGLKVLGILIALVIVASSVAMYGYSGTEGEKG